MIKGLLVEPEQSDPYLKLAVELNNFQAALVFESLKL